MLLVVTGPPGAGKSTVASLLVERFDRSVLVEGDAFFGSLRRGAIEPWLPESREQNDVVVRAAAAATGEYVRGGFATVYDGVMEPAYMRQFLQAAGLEDCDYAVLLPTVEQCLRGITERVGHEFADEDATRKMYGEFADAGVDPRHLITDTSGGVDAVVDRVMSRLESGDLRLSG